MNTTFLKIILQAHCQAECFLPSLLHVQVIEHLDQGDSNFIYVLRNHRLLQDTSGKLDTVRERAGISEHDDKGVLGLQGRLSLVYPGNKYP